MSLSKSVAAENRAVYACSGCADVGEIADQIARKLRKEGFATAKDSCLAGIGAGLTSFIDAAKAAEEVVTIDGCPVLCAKRTLEKINLAPKSIILTEFGCEKGKTTCNAELVNELVEKITISC
jgi:uncharacterized metal-binding protein